MPEEMKKQPISPFKKSNGTVNTVRQDLINSLVSNNNQIIQIYE